MMMRTRHGSAVISLPNDLDIVLKRDFEAPIELVFDVLTKPEHVTRWFFDQELRECSIDLRVGGNYHFVAVMDDGREMGFHGTFLELERPTRFVDTWVFEGRPDDEAIEAVDLHEAGGVTTMTSTLTFRDRGGRDRMTEHGFDGLQESYDRVEDLLRTLTG
ncbi:MAG TPA: SRPBCC domain-containing protein [Candidatus Dormibacteraeota bacterium]|nr:SRPBCC domain-containing protein [Candidatus Dormibacteraeota bacterium]